MNDRPDGALSVNDYTLSFQLDYSPIVLGGPPGPWNLVESHRAIPKLRVFLGETQIGVLSRCSLSFTSTEPIPRVEFHFCENVDDATLLSQETRDRIAAWATSLKGLLGVTVTTPESKRALEGNEVTLADVEAEDAFTQCGFPSE